MLRVKRGETAVAGRAVEQHHVAEDAFGVEHTREQIPAELAVELGRSDS